ncbi:hypothetical protein [Acetobacter peroxydans]|uniref:Uncharacterized protein n=1 Tax=Acetobacter peroxydans TaxID=104098 RepID=A0A4Y3TQ06_9PROT|nr:hypothetical protein [Acetobacter peroxydans]NHO15021.1 hypothetical protein [Acetobacter peroxydans]GBR35988.1 hypothetical protein AA13755_1384 [Acetobacter peroxydans NBRC 13755]GBR40835.1 hypothetical protein AA0475_0810 [Acetobacter peroxydans]GEB85111.1 hypothetical protein APE01nite_09080 [Acetobacter peroxydans]
MKENASRTGCSPFRTPEQRYTRSRRHRHYACLLALLGVTACGYNDSRRAHKGQLAVIGMTSEDLQACAGIPDKTAQLDDHVQIFQYTRTINVPSTNDSTLFPLQTVVNLTQTSMGGAGKTCIASIRLVDGRVTDMHYSGDNDRMIGSDGVCATLVKGCLTTPPASARSVSSNPLFGPVSAFHAPSLPTPGAKPREPAVHYSNATAPQDTLAPLPAPVSELPDTSTTTASGITPDISATQGASASLTQTAQPSAAASPDVKSSSDPELPDTIAKAAPDTPPARPAASPEPVSAASTVAPSAGNPENSNQAAAVDPTNPAVTPENTCLTSSASTNPANGSTQSPAKPSEKADVPCGALLDHKS